MAIPIDRKLELMAQDTLEALQRNFKIQKIFPYEVYPGYLAKNAKARLGSWKSTGAALDSFYFQVKDAMIDNARIDFFYNYYMNFVDIGVGAGRPGESVKRSAPYHHMSRYTNWNPKAGKTHRPAVSSEFRHLRRRMTRYFMNEYTYQANIMIINALGVYPDESQGAITEAKQYNIDI